MRYVHTGRMLVYVMNRCGGDPFNLRLSGDSAQFLMDQKHLIRSYGDKVPLNSVRWPLSVVVDVAEALDMAPSEIIRLHESES